MRCLQKRVVRRGEEGDPGRWRVVKRREHMKVRNIGKSWKRIVVVVEGGR